MDNITPILQGHAARIGVAIKLLKQGDQQGALEYLERIKAKLPAPTLGNIAAADADFRRFLEVKK